MPYKNCLGADDSWCLRATGQHLALWQSSGINSDHADKTPITWNYAKYRCENSSPLSNGSLATINSMALQEEARSLLSNNEGAGFLCLKTHSKNICAICSAANFEALSHTISEIILTLGLYMFVWLLFICACVKTKIQVADAELNHGFLRETEDAYVIAQCSRNVSHCDLNVWIGAYYTPNVGWKW